MRCLIVCVMYEYGVVHLFVMGSNVVGVHVVAHHV